MLVCDADGDATPTSARVSTASRFDPGLMIRAITNCSNIDGVLHVSSLSTKRVALQVLLIRSFPAAALWMP